jgi:crotonobetainyl-CoA:carnitine CoA-transferase CaiB-like acyl-CoA transferase/NTP pyrophosphatase (non-canonical NTP hydrolase)
MGPDTTTGLPLRGLRILDLTEGAAQSCGRYLADLGAQVILVEPPGGSAGRAEPAAFALRNANKTSVVLDLDQAAGRAELLRLAGFAAIALESASPATAAARGLTPAVLRQAHPGLVVVSITGFGQTGPYRDFAATEPVLTALAGVLSRSGRPGAAPVLPPAGLIEPTVGVHAAWAALVAYVHRLRTGIGEHVDVSALEAVVHGFDPGFGTQGSAAAGRPESFPRGRPDASDLYPVFGCADGHVRICVLARRQWRAMFSWLGEPAEFADPRYDAIPARYEAAARLNPLIAALFADATRADLVAEGTRRGIPVAGVLTPAEVLATGHFTASGTLIDAEIADGLTARIPSGYVSVDGVRAGLRQRAPRPGEQDVPRTAPPGPAAAPPWSATEQSGLATEQSGLATEQAAGRHWPVPSAASGQPPDGWSPGDGPLAGLRVLDLGVIVFGAELGRLFADQGADVIKIENSAFPDGLRQTRKGGGMNASFAWGHRNKRGLGLDLRTDEGRRLVGELARQADVVAANFKPGTLASLGLSHAELSEVNQGIVVCESSAFGSRGPWRERLGYGPLVRASCGVTALWRDPELPLGDPAAFCDGSTVYPDHIAGHVAAVAVLAALIGRSRSARGAAIEIAQADVALMHLGPALAAESLALPPAAHVPAAVFSCAGDDEWCVIDVRDDADWASLAQVLGQPELAGGDLATACGRLRRRTQVEDLVARWTAARPPAQVMSVLQAAGVPAGAMLRLPDELTDPHLTARESFRTLAHPLLSRPVPANARIAHFSSVPDPPLRPAPMPGEHTRDIARTLLGLTGAEIDRLVRADVLQLPQEAVALPAIPGAITPETAGEARMPGLAAQPSADRRNSARRAPAAPGRSRRSRRVRAMRDIGELTERLRHFAAARDWEQFHTPKNLAMALAGEAGELLAEFQWLTPEEAAGIMTDPQAAGQVRSEIADVFLYLIRLADVLGVDLLAAAADKLAENDRRYDAATYRGSRHKAPRLS